MKRLVDPAHTSSFDPIGTFKRPAVLVDHRLSSALSKYRPTPRSLLVGVVREPWHSQELAYHKPPKYARAHGSGKYFSNMLDLKFFASRK